MRMKISSGLVKGSSSSLPQPVASPDSSPSSPPHAALPPRHHYRHTFISHHHLISVIITVTSHLQQHQVPSSQSSLTFIIHLFLTLATLVSHQPHFLPSPPVTHRLRPVLPLLSLLFSLPLLLLTFDLQPAFPRIGRPHLSGLRCAKFNEGQNTASTLSRGEFQYTSAVAGLVHLSATVTCIRRNGFLFSL